jgi:hypothetical protein
VKIEWSPAARASARRYMADQDGMHAIGAAITQLASSPYPPEALHRGDYHRLRAGPYRVSKTIWSPSSASTASPARDAY